MWYLTQWQAIVGGEHEGIQDITIGVNHARLLGVLD